MGPTGQHLLNYKIQFRRIRGNCLFICLITWFLSGCLEVGVCSTHENNNVPRNIQAQLGVPHSEMQVELDQPILKGAIVCNELD